MDAAEMDVIRATARLPGFHTEIEHMRAVEDGTEEISIALRAIPRSRPSFVRLKPPVVDAGHAVRLAGLLSGPRVFAVPVGARAATTERRCIAFRGGERLAGLDRRAQGSLGLVIATVGFLPRSRRTCAVSIGVLSASFPQAKLITKDETLASPPELGKLWPSAIAYQDSRTLIRRNIPGGY
jgi:hypothetical protein